MPNYLLLYRGPATPPDQISPEQGEAIMSQWMAWMGRVGDAMVDLGAPTGERGGLTGDGSKDASASDVTGYTVVSADSLADAKALCAGHPFLSDGTDDFTVEVYELVPVGPPEA